MLAPIRTTNTIYSNPAELQARNGDRPPKYSHHDQHNGPKPEYKEKDPYPIPKYRQKDPNRKHPAQRPKDKFWGSNPPRSLDAVELLARALEDDEFLAAREPSNLRWYDARSFDEAELEARDFDEMEWLEARTGDRPPPYHPFDPVNGPTPPYSRKDPNPPPKYHKKDPNRKKSWQFWKKGKRSVDEFEELEARTNGRGSPSPPPYLRHDPWQGPKPPYTKKDPYPPPKYSKKDPKEKKPWQFWKKGSKRSIDELEELEARTHDELPPYSPHDPINGEKPKYAKKDPNPPPRYHKKDPKNKKPWQVWKGKREVGEGMEDWE